MSVTKSILLTLTFEIYLDGCENLAVNLMSAEPRGVFHEQSKTLESLLTDSRVPEDAKCERCAFLEGQENFHSNYRCDACAAEQAAENTGYADFIEFMDQEVPKTAGTLVLVGRMVWSHWSGIDGEDWSEEFDVESRTFTETPA